MLKESQQQNRRFEQEIDSLNFRNQQLTKRVTVLQEEAEQQQINSKKKQKKGQQQPEGRGLNFDGGVLENELQNKIEENASLHQRIFDLEEDKRRGWLVGQSVSLFYNQIFTVSHHFTNDMVE